MPLRPTMELRPTSAFSSFPPLKASLSFSLTAIIIKVQAKWYQCPIFSSKAKIQYIFTITTTTTYFYSIQLSKAPNLFNSLSSKKKKWKWKWKRKRKWDFFFFFGSFLCQIAYLFLPILFITLLIYLPLAPANQLYRALIAFLNFFSQLGVMVIK